MRIRLGLTFYHNANVNLQILVSNAPTRHVLIILAKHALIYCLFCLAVLRRYGEFHILLKYVTTIER